MAQQDRTAHDDQTAQTVHITILGSLTIVVGERLLPEQPNASRRLIAYLALHARRISRSTIAGTLWPEATDARAGVSLRAALSRLDPEMHAQLSITSTGIALAPTVSIDLTAAKALAYRLLDPSGGQSTADLSIASTATLSRELLPDWYDEWVIVEAEDWRQLRMTALEALAQLLILEQRLPEAAGAARAAIRAEPYRETAHVTLIEVHLAEGNQSEALRVYERYRELLGSGLNLEPTDRMKRLIAPLLRGSVDRLAT